MVRLSKNNTLDKNNKIQDVRLSKKEKPWIKIKYKWMAKNSQVKQVTYLNKRQYEEPSMFKLGFCIKISNDSLIRSKI